MSAILDPKSAPVRCSCVVDLISRVRRPYLFRVTVDGEYPHAHRQIYVIAADSDNSAALKGLELFTKAYTPSAPVREAPTLAPKAKLA